MSGRAPIISGVYGFFLILALLTLAVALRSPETVIGQARHNRETISTQSIVPPADPPAPASTVAIAPAPEPSPAPVAQPLADALPDATDTTLTLGPAVLMAAPPDLASQATVAPAPIRPSPTTPAPTSTAVATASPAAALARATRAPNQAITVPIFMYHHVGPLPPNPDRIRIGLTVPAADFEAQLRFLSSRGYQSISFDQLLGALENGTALPARSAILTFDDGYRDNFEVALPLLQRYQLTGTFFVITDLVGREIGDNQYMTWDQIQKLAATNMSIQSHTRTHPDLSRISRAALGDELRGSRQVLEEHLGRPVRYLCYPAGQYNGDVIRLTRESGYRAAVTVNYGLRHTLSSLFELTRVRVSGGATLGQFASTFGEKL